jgi:hypothetical protein
LGFEQAIVSLLKLFMLSGEAIVRRASIEGGCSIN